MQLGLFLHKVIIALSFSAEVWMSLLLGAIVTIIIAYIIYRVQKKEAKEHKQDHDAKLERIEQLHLQDSEKIKVLYELIIQSQKGSIGEFESDAIEKKIEVAADQITNQDSHHAQALKAIADKQKDEADNLLEEITRHEHDLENLYDLHALNEYRHGNYVDSVTWLGKLVDLKPDNLDYKLRLLSSLNDAGQYDEAETLARKVLAKLQSDSPGDAKNIVGWLYSLGSVLYRKDQMKDAELYYNQALELGKQTMGPEHPDIYNLYNDLGLIYGDRGDFEQAEEYFKIALKIKENVTEQDLITTAYITCNLASLYGGQGKPEQAEALYKDGMKSMLELLGENHPVLTYFYNNLGGLYFRLKKYPEAEELQLKAKAIFELKHLTSHPSYVFFTNSLGHNCLAQGKLEEAEAYFRATLDMVKKNSGDVSMSAATVQNNLSQVYLRLNQLEQAESLLEKNREILESIPDAPKHRLALTYKQLADINIMRKDYIAAEANLNKSNEILAELFDAEHNDMVTNKHNLAHVYLETERSAEAEKLLLEILPFLEKNLPTTPFYASALNNLAEINASLGKHEEAEKYKTKAEELTAK